LEFADLLDTLTIVVDSREKKNDHIIKQFESRGIKYEVEKLDWSDYSFRFDNKDYTSIIGVERKRSLDELGANISKYRDRFSRQLDKSDELYLMVEDEQWSNIVRGKYRNNVNVNSYIASLFTFIHRYDLNVSFINSQYSALFIFNLFKYKLREDWKGGEFN